MIPLRLGCLLAFVVPFLELVVLLVAASTFGWWPVLLWIIGSFIIGWIVVRVAAARTGRSWAQAVRLMQQQGQGDLALTESAPSEATVPAALPAPPAQTLLLVPAGILIAIPGFLSDLAGIVLLLPPVRRRIATRWAARLRP
ncbi:MAG: FxsA family protein [Candidatus Nanopelagicales bacterium]|jgi:UPF0716 protein FxsA